MQTSVRPDGRTSPFVEPWRPTPRGVIGTTIVVAAIATVSIATFAVQRIWFTPQAVVENYFAALADRDATAAASYVGSSGTSIDGLLSSEAYVPPSGLKVLEMKSDDNQRVAKVRFKVGDTTAEGELRLSRKPELTAGMFRGWAISSDRPTLQLSGPTLTGVLVNGKPAPSPEVTTQIAVFPGRYVVSSGDNPLLESDPVTADVGFGDQEVMVEPRVKASANAAADGQIKAYLAACLKSAGDGCPIGGDDKTWKITKYPVIAVRLGEGGELFVETTTDGVVSVTGRGYGGVPYTDTRQFDVDGRVAVDQGKVVYIP
ncbi:hypothetical protein HPO96_17890 [Kribbella sandramycini]|uniref:Uncharacterized protein n=1 Tax=Kribbella sandramycini TaxID=60450 RepID=A0A7Y4L0M4_9ACTN|nr:hypothetical protein [Kribbella sandramycini]MBB6565856.1 hypothetical protein [Kribbella sandramycini]NOL42120.1 hypothetical protein [Kribbella sandramycini]